MGLSQSRSKRNDALAVVASPTNSPIPNAAPLPSPHGSGNGMLDMNTSLNDSVMLLSRDAEWLDEGEMRAMEDEDAIMVREISATNSGEMPLADWLKSREADTRMNVRVVSHTTLNKFMGRRTVEYTIETDTGTVKRRYKDFLALRYGLEVRFPGAIVPPLPGSKQFGKTEQGFLLKRKRALQLFLQTVARHPFLSADDLFVEFIASTARFDRKTAHRQRSWLMKAQKWSVAARRWAQALIEAETPANPQATMEAASAELVLVQKHLQGLKTAMKRSASTFSAMADSTSDVASGFQKSSAQESQLVLFSGSTDQAAPMPLPAMFAQAQNLASQTADIGNKYPDLIDEAILSPIRFEMASVETFQEALRRAKFSINRHRQAINAYRQARDQSEVGSFKHQASALQLAVQAEVPAEGVPTQTAQLLQPTSPSDIEKQRKRLQRMRLTAVQAQMNARRDINGILAIELQRFRLERQMRMNKSFSDYAMVMKSQSDRVSSVWSMVASSSSFVRPPQEEEQPSRIEPPPNSPPPSLAAMDSSSYIDQPGLTTRRASQLRAKYPFQGMHEDELDVHEGERLVGDVDENNPEWVRAQSLVTGKSGLVPKTYVEELQGGDDDDDGEADFDYEHKNDSSDPTNFIKQTQDMFKGTKRTNADRETGF